ncbi:MAG: cadherin repeat domain-containing protein, partial [Ekhidna sp.]|nr:cadherin repeat domain-containing protein [Ekhidna sp.]
FGLALVACGDDDEKEPANTAPTITNQTFSVAEDATNGTVVGTVKFSDPDGDDMIILILSASHDRVFAINTSSGVLTLRGALDYETTQTYTLEVEVSDSKLETTAVVTINVTDVAENTAPAISDQTFSVAEDATNGTAVGTVKATDAEDDDLTFSITSGNTGDVFAIAGSTGAITVAGSLDFETTSTYTLKVSVSDGTLSDRADIIINVTDVIEGGKRDETKEINSLEAVGNTNPSGLWSDGTTMWVLEFINSKLFAYKLADGTLDAAKDISIPWGQNGQLPVGLWSDGTTIWILILTVDANNNNEVTDGKIYAYTLADGMRDAAKDIETLRPAGNEAPVGLWSDGTTMWVTDRGIYDEETSQYTKAPKIYAYSLPK